VEVEVDEAALMPAAEVVARLIRVAVVPLTLVVAVVAWSMLRLAEDHISPQVAVSSRPLITLLRSVVRTLAHSLEPLVLGQRRFIPVRV
jgi:hypothetical protein